MVFLIKWFYNNQYITKKTFRFFSERFFLCQHLLALPLLRKDGIQPILYAVDFLALPYMQSQQAVIQRRAVVCTGVEVFKVFLDGFHNLAVLITERCAPKSKNFVDCRTYKMEKCSLMWNISPNVVIFSFFFAYLCNVIDDFCLFRFAALSKVKNLTW